MHIGKYKGYDVYKTPKNEMEYNENKSLYAVAETGELVLKGELRLRSMMTISVTDISRKKSLLSQPVEEVSARKYYHCG